MLGTLAACLRFRRPRGRGRRSALLNVGPRLAARRRLPPSRRLTPPGSFRPSSRLRSSGARAKRKRLRIDGLHSPTTQCRYAAQPAKKERKPCGLDDRTACLVRRLAPAERRSFSRLDRCRVFQCLDFRPQFLPMSGHLIECGLASLVDFHPGHVSSAIFAGLRKLHPSKAVTSNATPKTAGQFAPSVRLRCKRRGHLPFRRQDLPGALLVLALCIAPAGRRWGRAFGPPRIGFPISEYNLSIRPLLPTLRHHRMTYAFFRTLQRVGSPASQGDELRTSTKTSLACSGVSKENHPWQRG